MTYTGTYRARQSASLHRQDAVKAAELEKDRKETIRDYKAVASDWKTEQSRLNSLQKLNDQIKATNDAATWKAFDAMVQKAVVPFVKSQWDDAIAAGEEAAAAGDADPDAKNEIREKIKKLESQGDNADELINELVEASDSEVYKSNLLGQQTMYRKGYKRGLVKEALAGYGTARLNYLAESEDTVYNKKGDAFKVKDFRDHEGGYEIVSRQFRKNWYEQFRGTVSPNFLTATASPVINKIEFDQKTTYYRGVRVDDAENNITGNYKNLTFTATDSNTSAQDLADQLVLMNRSNKNNLTIIQPRSGVNTENNTRNVAWLKKVIADNPWDTQLQRKLKEAHKLAQIKDHPTGPGSYADKRPLDYGPNAIDNYFNDERKLSGVVSEQEKKKYITGVSSKIISDRNAALEEGKPLSEEYIASLRLALQESPYVSDDPQAMIQLIGLAEKKPLSNEKGWEILKNAAENTKLSVAQAEALAVKEGFSPVLVQDGIKAGFIVEDPFVDGSSGVILGKLHAKTRATEIVKASVQRYKIKPDRTLTTLDNKAIDVLLKEGIQGTGNDTIDTPGLDALAEEMFIEARDIKKSPITKETAYLLAETELLGKFKALQEARITSHKLYIDPEKGFTINLAAENAEVKRLNRQNIIVNELTDHIQDGGLKKLYTVPPASLRASDFYISEYGTNNQPARIFQLAAAADTQDKHTPWDFRNQWLKAIKADKNHPLHDELKNEQETEMPVEFENLRERITGEDFWLLSNWKASPVIRNRALINGGIPNSGAQLAHVTAIKGLNEEDAATFMAKEGPRFDAMRRINMQTVKSAAMQTRGRHRSGGFDPNLDLDSPEIQTLLKQFNLTKYDFL